MEGQLNSKERELITSRIRELRPDITLEVGTWLGGGSTLHILKALVANQNGHLWGIEAYREVHDKMIANIRSAGEEIVARFTPLFGFSDKVIPVFLEEKDGPIGFVFLDGGDNPMEQVTEFRQIRDRVPVGGVLMSHDAKLRKGKWLVPYLSAHDNWETTLHDVSTEGLFEARKTGEQPSQESRKHAERVLSKLRREPVEVLGKLMPSELIGAIARVLPDRLVKRLTQGRK